MTPDERKEAARLEAIAQLNSTKICGQPWFGVTIKPNGIAGICCEIPEELADMHVSSHTFQQMQNHPQVIRIRNDMLDGREPPECWRCFDKEKLGGNSLRHVLNEVYIGYNETFDPLRVIPQNIEFVLGNLCQLQCIMCHPARSKKIENVQEYIKITDMRKSFVENLVIGTLPESFKTDWVEDDILWDKIAEQSVKGRRFFINGGEPLLARSHYKVLQRLIDAGTAHQAVLTYSTNGLLLNTDHMEIWKNFKEVSVAFSIDDIGERNHFIRYPSNWAQVTAALDRVVKWQENPEYKDIQFGIWCAVNILNFPYIAEFIEFFASKYPTISIKGLRAVQTPSYLNPAILPYSIKRAARDEFFAKLDEYPDFKIAHAHITTEIEMILETPENLTLLDDGIAFVKMQADFYRVDLKQTFPKLAHLM